MITFVLARYVSTEGIGGGNSKKFSVFGVFSRVYKRKQVLERAQIILHWSDCSLNNGPAYESGPCDCGWAKADTVWWRRLYRLFCIRLSALQMSLEGWLIRRFGQRGKIASKAIDLIWCIPGPGKHARPDDPLYRPRKYAAQPRETAHRR